MSNLGKEPKIIRLARAAIKDGVVAPLNRVMLERIDALEAELAKAERRLQLFEACTLGSLHQKIDAHIRDEEGK